TGGAAASGSTGGSQGGQAGARGTGSARRGSAAIPGVVAAASPASAAARTGSGASAGAGHAPAAGSGAAAGPDRQNPPPNQAAVPQTGAQEAFISQIAPGAVAAQQRYGVPASVTIAQAIDESGWGRSELASQDHNLFGIKGTGPAGSVEMPTQEYING